MNSKGNVTEKSSKIWKMQKPFPATKHSPTKNIATATMAASIKKEHVTKFFIPHDEQNNLNGGYISFAHSHTILPVNNSLLIDLIIPASKNGEIAASSVPNSESMPSNINIMKNMTAKNGEAFISNIASENAIKARPGPEPTWKK